MPTEKEGAEKKRGGEEGRQEKNQADRQREKGMKRKKEERPKTDFLF